MNSIVDEKYSIIWVFYLFSFLLFLSGTSISQEVLWSTPGVGERPNLSVQGTKQSEQRVIISSPFGTEVKVTKLSDGSKVWTKKLVERVSYGTLALTDALVVQGDQGTIWAIRGEDGEELWMKRTPEPLDYPMGPPRFRDQAVFTISHQGVIRKLIRTGEQSAVARRDVSWGERRAAIVPLRSNQQQLSYLDQAGRLTTYDTDYLDLISTLSLIPDESQANVLAGAVSEDGNLAWVSDFSGRLVAVRPTSGERLWSVRTGKQENCWSEQGELLTLPSLLVWEEEQIAVLTIDRFQASIYKGDTGKRLTKQALPSPAVAPPIYDSVEKRWWLLCRSHLVSYDRKTGWAEYPLTLVDEPFALAIGDKTLVVGSLDGRVYRLSMPGVDQESEKK
jgi:hypothetical protein